MEQGLHHDNIPKMEEDSFESIDFEKLGSIVKRSVWWQ